MNFIFGMWFGVAITVFMLVVLHVANQLYKLKIGDYDSKEQFIDELLVFPELIEKFKQLM